MKNIIVPLRKKISDRLIKESDTPVIIYITVVLAIGLALGIGYYHEDLSLNLVSEIIGAAFTLFVIDVLLVRSKTRRWKVVSQHIDYLIARNINRLRDGVSARIFSFQPRFNTDLPDSEKFAVIREQREEFLIGLSFLDVDDLGKRISAELFTEDTYEYLNEKAEDIWDIINMKYSEYLAPELVSMLIKLHTNLKDVCGHIRFYKKSERYVADKGYYISTATKGAALNLKEIVAIVVRLKEEGYSESAKVG